MTSPSLPTDPRPGAAYWLGEGILYCYPPTSHDEASIRAYYANIISRLEARTGKYVVVSDTRHVRTLPDARARKLHGELGHGMIGRFQDRCVHSVTVVDNLPMRAILTAVLWFMSDAKNPQDVVGSIDEALRIAERVIKR
jgi:hypothetical protein